MKITSFYRGKPVITARATRANSRATAECQAGRGRRGDYGPARRRVTDALDALTERGEPLTYAAIVTESGVDYGRAKSTVYEMRLAGWRWGQIVAIANGLGRNSGGVTDRDELARRVAMVRAEGTAATRDRPGEPARWHAAERVELTELEAAKVTCDEMRRDGRRRGLLGKGKGKRRRAA